MFSRKTDKTTKKNRMKQPLTEKEKRLQQEIEMQKAVKDLFLCDCFGLHYPLHFYRKHTPEEVEEQWKNDIKELKRILAEYEKQ